MKKELLSFCFLVFSSIISAQSYQLTRSKELTAKGNVVSLEVIATDTSGVYLSQSREVLKGAFVVGLIGGYNVSLMKLDKNLQEVYSKHYKDEFKGLAFHSFQQIGDDLYVFATDYNKKNNKLVLSGAKINKATGELTEGVKEITWFLLEKKWSNYELTITARDEKSFMVVYKALKEESILLNVCLVDLTLKKGEHTIIDLSFSPGYYSLQDVALTEEGKILLVGKEFEETETGGKKKEKQMVFKQYILALYDKTGTKEKDITADSGGNYLINGKLTQLNPRELLLTGFYSDNAGKERLSGVYLYKIDLRQGEVLQKAYSEITPAMLVNPAVSDKNNMFPNNYAIRAVNLNRATNSIIIMGESSTYSTDTRTTISLGKASSSGFYDIFNKDILIVNTSMDGKIQWLNTIPKSQLEQLTTYYTTATRTVTPFEGYKYIPSEIGMPYYSSFKSMLYNSTLVLLLNDHSWINTIPAYGEKGSIISEFEKKSSAFLVFVDLLTGKMMRKNISSNTDYIMMPRQSFVSHNDFFVAEWRPHSLKTLEFKLIRVSITE